MTIKSMFFAIALSFSAQSTDPTIQAMNEAISDAIRAVEEASNADAEKPAEESQRQKRVAEIDASMRLVANDPELGDKLPLPMFVRRDEIEAALRHNAAWISGDVRADRISALIDAADSTGTVLYYEWACRTGRETQSVGAFFGVLDANLTSYPQRLLLKHSMDMREILGYGSERRCSAQALETWRQRQSDALQRATS